MSDERWVQLPFTHSPLPITRPRCGRVRFFLTDFSCDVSYSVTAPYTA
jgi:hypothetical protein